MFSVCAAARHAEDSGGEITGFKRARRHTRCRFVGGFFDVKCQLPLNHRHNSPRSSGLRLSALLPEKEAGDIHHGAAG